MSGEDKCECGHHKEDHWKEYGPCRIPCVCKEYTPIKLTGLPIEAGRLDAKVEWLRANGTSLVMNWGDEGWWEVSWISSGKRFTEISTALLVAIDAVLRRGLAETNATTNQNRERER